MIEVVSHISIHKNGSSFLDVAKINLLKEIMLCGSLSGAAKKLKISYQHAWNMIGLMNTIAPEPMVDMQRGGTNGGGALVTVYGRRMVLEYNQIEQEVNKIVSQINVEINL